MGYDVSLAGEIEFADNDAIHMFKKVIREQYGVDDIADYLIDNLEFEEITFLSNNRLEFTASCIPYIDQDNDIFGILADNSVDATCTISFCGEDGTKWISAYKNGKVKREEACFLSALTAREIVDGIKPETQKILLKLLLNRVIASE